MPHVESIGGRVWYESVGEGPPLVFLHGLSLDRRMWAAQVSHFSRRWRCILVDRRGHGLSDPPGEGWSAMADLAAVLDDAEAGQAFVVGLSLGGWDAVCFALEAPRRVRGIALIDAYLPALPEAPFGDGAAAHKLARAEGPAAATAQWLQSPLFAPALARPELGERLRRLVEEHTWIEARLRVGRGPEPAVPYHQRLNEVAVPALVICGRLDVASFQIMAQTYQRRLPRADRGGIAWIEGAGHMASMEVPTAVNAALEGFLNAHRPKPHGLAGAG